MLPPLSCSLGSKWQSPGRNPGQKSIPRASVPLCCLWRRQVRAQCQGKRRQLLIPRFSPTPGEGVEKQSVTIVDSWPACRQLQRTQNCTMVSTLDMHQEMRPTVSFQFASVVVSNGSRAHPAASIHEYPCPSLDNKQTKQDKALDCPPL